MATNKIYVNPGAIFAFLASAATNAPSGATTIVWTPQNVAASNGRISADLDRGASAKPMRYAWRMRTKWASAPTSGDSARIYLIHADAIGDATQCDGGWASGLGSDSATATEVPLLYQATYLGSVVSGGALQAESTSGICGIHSRYVSVAIWNASVAGVSLSNVANDHIFTLTELPDEIEAAS
jgi:hypothetical protein